MHARDLARRESEPVEQDLLDQATGTVLAPDDTRALVWYTVSADDVAGPFAEIPADMMEKATLPRMDYASPLESLAERFHVSPSLLQDLNPGAALDAAVLGYVGSTGNASPATPHLHFGFFRLGEERVWWKSTAIDSYPVLTRRARLE